VDVEIRPHWDKRDNVHFAGCVSANKAKGVLREHLPEIAELLKNEEIEGVSLKSDGRRLQFTGAFRDSVLRKLGAKPKLPLGEPPEVQHLGGFKFKVGDREVEFGDGRLRGGKASRGAAGGEAYHRESR